MLVFGLILLVLFLATLYENQMSRTDFERHPPPGRMADIGGYRLHMHCTGTGGPTVVLDSGLGDSSQVWVSVQQKLSDRVRVCSYDRAGLGWSDPGPLPRTYKKAAEELHRLLEKAGEAPPYILVGHSAGVNTVRLLAEAYPDDVGGLVLIEPPVLPDGVPPVLVAVLRAGRVGIQALSSIGLIRLLGRYSLMGVLFGGANPPKELSERAGFLYRTQSIKASLDEIDAIDESIRLVNATARPGAWRDWPVVILAASRRESLPDALAHSLESLAGQSTDGRVLSVKSSHFVHFDQPELVAETILEVVEAAR